MVSRRPPLPLGDIGQASWNQARGPLYRYLKRLLEDWSGIPGGFKNTAPPTVLVGGTASAGTENASWMAANAQLVAATGTPSGLGNANAAGASTAAPRLDHVHKRDVRVALNGSDVGTRNRINFIAPAGTITDDAGNDEVDVDLAAVASAGAADAELLAWVGIAMRQSSRS